MRIIFLIKNDNFALFFLNSPEFFSVYLFLSAQFVRELFLKDKMVAAICHAGWVLASARILKGRKVTCFFAIKDDLVNAGAEFIDREVVVDGNLITSRSPYDLPAFCREIIKFLKT